jgi:hypothetical protein
MQELSMPEPSIQILLAEHARLRELERILSEKRNRTLNRYMTAFLGTAVLCILILEGKISVSHNNWTVFLTTTTLLLFGESTFFNLLHQDDLALQIGDLYNKIRAKFTERDRDLGDVFLEAMTLRSDKFPLWITLYSIFKRSLTISGAKTAVLLSNSLVLTGMIIFLRWPMGRMAGILIAAVVFSVYGVLHAAYASWRYKKMARAEEATIGIWV